VEQWRRRVVDSHAAIFRAVTRWVDPAQAAASLPNLIGRRLELAAGVDRAFAAVARARRVLVSFVQPAGPIPAVVLVGLGGANGWVASVRGAPTLFVAVERLPEPGLDVVLALHEMIHLVHLQRAAGDRPVERVDAARASPVPTETARCPRHTAPACRHRPNRLKPPPAPDRRTS
jgi:hypothetical protein